MTTPVQELSFSSVASRLNVYHYLSHSFGSPNSRRQSSTGVREIYEYDAFRAKQPKLGRQSSAYLDQANDFMHMRGLTLLGMPIKNRGVPRNTRQESASKLWGKGTHWSSE